MKRNIIFEKLCVLCLTVLTVSQAAVWASPYLDKITINTTKANTDKTTSASSEVDYSKVRVITQLRSGGEVSGLRILDTLTAEVVGTDENADFKWQGSLDGKNWSVIGGENSNSFTPDYTNKYKYVRCIAKVGRLNFKGDSVAVPTRIPEAPSFGDGDEKHQLPKTQENSNPDYIFYVGSKGFVMLDAYDSADTAFYITTTDAYGDAMNASAAGKAGGIPSSKCVSAHGIYTVAADGSSIGNMLLSLGNNYAFFGDDSNRFYTLPQEMSEYIVKGIAYPIWVSNWLKTKNFYKSPQKADVWMLSWDDFIKYSDILGYKDNLYDVGGKYCFLRDGSPIEGWYTNCAVSDTGMSVCVKNETGVVRPAFFLKEDFFKNVKIDSLTSAGSKVIQQLKQRYSFEDLKKLYSEDELIKAGFSKDAVDSEQGLGLKTEITFTDTDLPTAKIVFNNSNKMITSAIVLFALYNDRNEITAVAYKSVKDIRLEVTESECSLEEFKDIKNFYKVDAVVLTGY